MKMLRQLFAIALLMIACVRGMAGVSAEEKRVRLRMLRTESFGKLRLTPLDRAYLDAFMVLGQQNTCSKFFGGHTAQDVLELLVIELREERMNDALFFSSRRRHTRLQGDWSSDVCSSDLRGDRKLDILVAHARNKKVLPDRQPDIAVAEILRDPGQPAHLIAGDLAERQ